ncbi:MAG: hypothetical protein HKN24_13675 [Acidimicrobiales bacterium]|nr:hypothetical protein [Acidimicrobiales bacterium]
MTFRLRSSAAVAALMALALAVSACSSGSTTEGVATLEDVDATPLGDAAAAETLDDAEPEVDAEQAALEFSACMRDEGLDFPDLSVDADGRLSIRQGLQGLDPGSEEVQAALEVCRPLIENVGFGGGQRAAIAENVEIQDALVEFSECVRDAGYDVGDIELGRPGPPAAGAGTEDGAPTDGQRGQGERQGGFGDRSARFAVQLGLDYEDPEVAAVVDECGTIIDDALAGAGIGQPGQ